ncbi:serine phosphatase RsbU (regulator of sigma subunit) [Limimaricola variabilis]|uniref:Serine phosphatase RsbU (Regulator of sigma subunit) n=2 Tax=Limimaricola variabilis TaxID=1492771 RepID=A0ABR6HTV0_9RHOB|nr:serine phosphatase RsbU (regulator of sigma subunit) [Limimaricola variabilis]
MMLRNTLNAVYAVIVATLLFSVVLQILGAWNTHRLFTALEKSNAARGELSLLAIDLSDQRRRAYLDRLGAPHLEIAPIRAGVTKPMLVSAATAVAERPELAVRAQEIDTRLAVLRQDAQAGELDADALFSRYTEVIEEVIALRLGLLSWEFQSEPVAPASAHLRRYNGLLLEYVGRNAALITGQVFAGEAYSEAVLKAARDNLSRARFALEQMQEQLLLQGGVVTPALERVIRSYEDRYFVSAAAVIEDMERGRDPADIESWTAFEREARAASLDFLTGLLATSGEALEDLTRRSFAWLLVWSVLLVLASGTAFYGWYAVRTRLIQPLDDIHDDMLKLADGRLDVELPSVYRDDEVGRMRDALRIFKANALRRARLQTERDKLLGRLKSAYRQLRLDLQAAATVQEALLPDASNQDGIRVQGQLKPSHYIAGDTYDVVRRSDGRLLFFQVDVAGHGAPAALVSVGAHNLLLQALIESDDRADLAAIVAKINADWPASMPYFTLALGEIDIQRGRGRLVQAGHPGPILMCPDRPPETLGDGGVPVGILTGNHYEEVDFDFPRGSRLLVYSDGLTEAENTHKEAFGEARLHAMLARAATLSTARLLDRLSAELRGWRGSDTLEDDVTLLVLEAMGRDED